MKTAISIPDPLFQEADSLAERLGLSRSELYARAVETMLRRHRVSVVRERLDSVYGEQPEASAVDAGLGEAQRQVLDDEGW